MRCETRRFPEVRDPMGRPETSPSDPACSDTYEDRLPTVSSVNFYPPLFRPSTPENFSEAFIVRLIDSFFETPEGDPNPVPNLKITGEFFLPLDSTGSARKYLTHSIVRLLEGGGIELLEATSRPPVGRIPFFRWLPVQDIPILGPPLSMDLKGIRMERPSRRLKIDGRFSLYHGQIDGSERIFKALGVERQDFQDRGLKPNRVPPRLSQLVGLILERQRRGQPGPRGLPLPFRPDWAEGRLEVRGDFSERAIEIPLEPDPNVRGRQARTVRLTFGKQARFVIEGPWTQPTVRVWGLETTEYIHPKRIVRVSSQLKAGEAQEMTLRFGPDLERGSLFALSWKQDAPMKVEELPPDRSEVLATLDLPRGGSLKNFRAAYYAGTPAFEIERIETAELRYEGHGIRLHTRPATTPPLPGGPTQAKVTALTDVSFRMEQGRPTVQGTISGRVEGEIAYLRRGRPSGRTEFRPLEGIGEIQVGPSERPEGPYRITVRGEVRAFLPKLRLQVYNKESHGRLLVRVDNARVVAEGRMTIVPESDAFEIAADRPHGVTVTGERADLLFAQETYRLLPRLATRLTIDERKRVRSHLHFNATGSEPDPGFRFVAHRLTVAPPSLEFPAAFESQESEEGVEIREVDLTQLRLRGELWGRLVAFHAASNAIVALDIPERARMIDATLEIERLLSRSDETGISDIAISGVESADTLTPDEQARCRFDAPPRRQHLHAALRLLGFSPAGVRVEGVDPHLHFNLIDRITGACVKLKAVPAPPLLP